MNPGTSDMGPHDMNIMPSDAEDSSSKWTSECDSGTVLEAGSESEAAHEGEVKLEPVTCELCWQAPHDWDAFGEEIWE